MRARGAGLWIVVMAVALAIGVAVGVSRWAVAFSCLEGSLPLYSNQGLSWEKATALAADGQMQPYASSGYRLGTHPWLAAQAQRLFMKKYPELGARVPASWWGHMIVGALEEDWDVEGTADADLLPAYSHVRLIDELPETTSEIVQYAARSFSISSSRCECHFYAPDPTDPAAPARGLTYGLGLIYPLPSLEWAQHRSNRASWGNGLETAHTAAGWRRLGHVLHLFHDLGSPAHVRNENHMAGCPIESGLLADTALYADHLSDLALEDINGSVAVPERKPGERDTVYLTRLWDDLARYTSTRYFSDWTVLSTQSPDPGYRLPWSGTRVPLAFAPTLSIRYLSDYDLKAISEGQVPGPVRPDGSRDFYLVATEGARQYPAARLTLTGRYQLATCLGFISDSSSSTRSTSAIPWGLVAIQATDLGDARIRSTLRYSDATCDDPYVTHALWYDLRKRLIAYQCELIKLFHDTMISTNGAPARPSITSPKQAAGDVVGNPRIRGSVFSDPDGDVHLSSTWEVHDGDVDQGQGRLVWLKNDDRTNRTETVVNTSSGDFVGPLKGATRLAAGTDYWVRVLYMDRWGASSGFSAASRFTTAAGPNNPPDQPSIATPAESAIGIFVNPTVVATAFSDRDAGDTHASSTWELYSDSACTTLVWSQLGDTSNLTSTTVNTTSGAFTGPLLGATLLVTSTSYWIRVKYKDSQGVDGAFSTVSKFTTADSPVTKKWEFSTRGVVEGSPAIGADGTIYIGSWDGSLYALNPDGTKRWEFVTGSAVQGSPSVSADGTVYIGSDDHMLYAINPADGSKKWEFATGSYVWGAPAIGADGTVYIGSSYEGRVYALDPVRGTRKWEFSTGSFVLDSPSLGADGTVYVGSYDNGTGGSLYALNPSDGSKKWQVAVDYSSSSPGTGADGTIYVGKLALDPTDGSTKWQAAGYPHPSPAIGADGTIYSGGSDGIYSLDATDGANRWRFTSYNVYSTPAVAADGTIYVGSCNDKKLYALNPDGTKKWELTTGAPVNSSPAIGADGTVYVGNDDGRVYAITSSSGGLVSSPWPKFHHDARNTGRASGSGTNNPPGQPSITQPTNNATDSSVNPLVQASTFSDPDAGDTHASSTWQLYSDSGCTTLVWSSVDDTSNLTKTAVTTVNGTFSGPLLGASELVTNTWYWLRVTYKDNRGSASTPSGATRFETVSESYADMVLIPAGPFAMGGTMYSNEQPIHNVYLDAFWIDRYPVTNRKYRVFVQATGHRDPAYWGDPRFNGDDQPVVGVSWDDAVAYATWAGKRLPTEAEREKAARGGLVGQEYPWGPESPSGRACWNTTQPCLVGSYAPNDYGLYDMVGNVFEWCSDWYDSAYYEGRPDPDVNPTGPASGTDRVVRGGSWSYGCCDVFLRCAYRSCSGPSFPSGNLGFRCVR
ncbi:MAG: SUMF1/EgtB/PvdO family nonheme iron enzyme [Candidatus Riflebacteria bacterium]|nr:SUMF1/EgtB/PvdO family nonheme iron enzyme [Candidatus Riflebacteria bacterium]